MDFHLDRRLRLLTEPEHKSLYSWAINEVDEHGQVVGYDQIPWPWGLYFTATEIVLTDQVTVSEFGEIEAHRSRSTEISRVRKIIGKLRPGDPHADEDWGRQTAYRMFGTDRIIKDFQLDISPLESELEAESCKAWGSVSYTSEIDFRYETIDDVIVFYLMVKSSAFDYYVQRISLGTADEVILRVGRVSCFYSEWSPSISTSQVKVLAGLSEHKVDMPEDASIEAPRLGSVGEVSLYINAKRMQPKKLPSANAQPIDDEQPLTSLVRPEFAGPPSAGIDPQTAQLLASLISSARWIVGMRCSQATSLSGSGA